MNKYPLFDSKCITTSDADQPGGYVLITGATGLLGQYLLRELYFSGEKRIAVIVRSSKKLTAVERIESILQRWETQSGSHLPRPVVFEGDVADLDLGLNQHQMDWIAAHCDRIIHSAAVLQFQGAGRDAEPWRTNFGGTRNVVNLARWAGIPQFHYVSTAYVCGLRESKILEDELDCQQEFRNVYEHSKFEAEKLVRQTSGFESKTIYRPAVIVGDSQTGYTSTYHGLFLYLRLLATLVPQQKVNDQGLYETPIRLPMSGDEPRNLVAVDWVAQVISRIFRNPEAHGKTFHMVPENFTTARQVIEYCYEYFNSHGVEFCGTSNERPPDNEFAAKFFENARVYESYETSDPEFDNTNVVRYAGDIPCPPIDKDVIHRFLDFGKSDAWGKRRIEPPLIKQHFATHLWDIARAFQSHAEHLGADFRLGIDVWGQGGGQWHIKLNGTGNPVILDGLPQNACATLRVDAGQVDELLSRQLTTGRATVDIWSTLIHSVLARGHVVAN